MLDRMHEYDAVIIGGGPAGATAAAMLGMHGRKVAVLEKSKFPRYHIGESLMPYCYFPLERLGLVERMKNSHYPKKYSVQFVSTSGKASQPFYFFQHFDHPAATTWQVVRSEFDTMLLDNAREKGAEVYEETKAKEIIYDASGCAVGVRAESKEHGELEFRSPITIDASGRDALAMARNKWRVRDPQLDKIAIWTYYRDAKRDPGIDEGSTTVAYLPEKGWFWYIPLPDDIVSVGIVAESTYLYKDTRDPAAIFAREIEQNAWIKEHLETGEQFGEYWATGEYSYRSRYCAADGLVLIGDAFAFLDPVFSSGVFLALRSGELAADHVHAALSAGDYSAKRFEAYGEQMCDEIESMRRLVYAFYDQNFSFKDLFMAYPDVRPDLTDCLIGNLQRDFDTLTEKMSEFITIPEKIQHGRAKISEERVLATV